MSDYSDYSTLQNPSGGYGSGSAGGYGSGQNSSPPYGNAPVRVADASTPKKEPRTPRKEWKEVKDGPRQKTSNIYILFYFSDISKTYTFDKFLQRLHGSSDPSRWFQTSNFISNGVEIVKKSSSKTVWSDLGNALYEPGAVVIYWGHSERANGSTKARN